MDTEDNTTLDSNELADSGGLLDRYDELFEADGDPKDGTESLLNDEDEDPKEDVATEEAAPEEEAESEETTEDATEEKEEDAAPADAFDAETAKKIAEMDSDAHPGIKFAELRTQLKEAQQQAESYKENAAQSEEFQTLKLQAERSEQLESQLQELQQQLNVVEYRATPEYKAQVEKPLEDMRNLSGIIEQGNSIAEGDVYRAVTMSDQTSQNRAIEALVEQHDLSKRDEVRLYAMADDVIKVNATQDHLKTIAETRMSELNEMEVSANAEASEKQSRAVANALSGTLDRYAGKMPGFIDNEGNPNDVWKQVEATTKDSSIASVDDEAHAIFAANALPHMLDHIKDLSSQLKDKNVLLSRYTKAKPSKDVAPKTQEDVKVDDGASFMDRLNNMKF